MRSVTGILFSYPLIDLLTHHFLFRSEEGDLGRIEERVLERRLSRPNNLGQRMLRPFFITPESRKEQTIK